MVCINEAAAAIELFHTVSLNEHAMSYPSPNPLPKTVKSSLMIASPYLALLKLLATVKLVPSRLTTCHCESYHRISRSAHGDKLLGIFHIRLSTLAATTFHLSVQVVFSASPSTAPALSVTFTDDPLAFYFGD